MSTIYVLLDTPLSSAQGKAFADAVDYGGRLAILILPQLAILDGDTSTVSALQGLIGNGVLAVGSDDVTDLLAAAASSPELSALVGTLGLTTSTATAAHEATRQFNGEDWLGLGCNVEGM